MVTDFEKRFGVLAVERGYITRDQLLEAMKLQVEQGLDGMEHRLLGSLLFDMGYMSIGQVNEVIEAIKQSE
ncbi:MAG: hypothetical protein DRH11_10065 [Deltaproteobacteria bacterium]|nr:MAG: hypothetical protein DRH11_10065 [Deltaproteobacteria bacterium]